MPAISLQGLINYSEHAPKPASLDGADALLTGYISGVYLAWDVDMLTGGDFAYHTPVDANKLVIPLTLVTSFSNDYYNRIHIVPSFIDVGNLTSDQTINVEVFNAYFEPKQLTSIDASGNDGIEVAGPQAPYTFPGLFSASYQYTVTTNGSPEIDALFVYNWDNARDQGSVNIIGSRIVMMPYVMISPVSETLEWNTQVMKSYNNTEQRIRLRKNPRQSFSCSFNVPPNEMGRAQNLVYGWLSRRWAVPQWTVAQRSYATYPIGTITFPVDTTVTDYRTGDLIALWSDERGNLTAEILTLTSSSITINKPTTIELINPWVMPAKIAEVSGSVKRITTGYNAKMSMEYDFINYKEIQSITAPAQYKGNDIYYEPSLFSESNTVTDEFNTRVDKVDYDTGVRNWYSPWRNSQIARPYRVVLQGLSQIWEFRKWLHRRAGKLVPFWTPTFENDMRVAHNGNVINVLGVVADDYKLFGFARKHIAIKTTSGVYLAREIVSVGDISHDVISLTLDEALNIDASLIKEISFLGLKRLDTDRIELNWSTNRVVECTMRMMEIEP